MKKKLIYISLLLVSVFGYSQTCPTLSSPMAGDTGVLVESTLSWNAVDGVTGYQISIGNAPGGTEWADHIAVGSATSFTPPTGLPENQLLHITITLFFFDRPDIECPAGSFRTEDVLVPPSCAIIRTPPDGATDVNSATTIGWSYVPKATGYRIAIGTSMGGEELLPLTDVGNVLSYLPVTELPLETEIFVRIIPYNENGPAPGICTEFSFTTGELAVLPGCTSLISPLNGSINVPLTPLIEWTAVPGASGYFVSIGSSPTVNDVIDRASFTENSTFVIDFDPNRTFFITIVPFNDAGLAIGCEQQSFSTILGCGPFFDDITGELVNLAPEIDFPDTVSFCQDQIPYTVQTEDTAEGFRWYKVESNGAEMLLSSTSEVSLTETGTYRYEAFNTISQATNIIECASSKEFNVVASEIATINGVSAGPGQNGTIAITVQASGIGDYEYALDNRDGPYQDGNVFTNVPLGSYTIYVRDKNGCGIAETNFDQDLTVDGFPTFFTPNGDGVNDLWQFVPPLATGEVNVRSIFIFDRYGRFIAQLDPLARGWDGSSNGSPLPSADYWFKAIGLKNEEIKGHFALKR